MDKKHDENMQRFLARAKLFSSRGDWEISLNQLRQFCEAFVEYSANLYTIDKKNKNWLNKTLTKIKSNMIESDKKLLSYALDYLHKLGNFGSHYQVDEVVLESEDVEYCILLAERILEVYVQDRIDIKELEIHDLVECPHCGQKRGDECIGDKGKSTTIHRQRYELHTELFESSS